MNQKISDSPQNYQHSIFAIVHPIIAGPTALPGQAVFYYHLIDYGAFGFHLLADEAVQLLPPVKHEESDVASLEGKLSAHQHLLNLRKETPYHIRRGEDLAVMRKKMADHITKLLDYSKPFL